MGKLDDIIPLPARRLPVYLIIDTSISMHGSLDKVKIGIEHIVNAFMKNPATLEEVYISIVTYDSKVEQLLPLTPVYDFKMPEIVIRESESLDLCDVVENIYDIVKHEVKFTTMEQRGDWQPLLWLMTNSDSLDLSILKDLQLHTRFDLRCFCICDKKTFANSKHTIVYNLNAISDDIIVRALSWRIVEFYPNTEQVGNSIPLQLPHMPKDSFILLPPDDVNDPRWTEWE